MGAMDRALLSITIIASIMGMVYSVGKRWGWVLGASVLVPITLMMGCMLTYLMATGK